MPSSKTVLEGIRVLDLGRYQAGPRCALMLARMGAEVIKIEGITGDESRKNGPKVRGQSAYWVQYNSGKKSIALNLRKDRGRVVLRDLVKVSDVLVQNFRPGTIDRMGFGYHQLKALNPGIVMVNVSAYGQYGPYRDRIGFDPIGQAISGLMSLTGFPDGPPVKTFFPLIDRITALHATVGALAALWERQFSGEGQSIDVSLADSGFSTNEIPIAAYLGAGTVTRREGNGSGLTNAYPSTDGWVYIVAVSDNIWPRVCEALDMTAWAKDSRLATQEGRRNHAGELEQVLSKWFSERSTQEAVDLLTSYDIPAAPVNDLERAAKDPHLVDREMMVEVPDPVAGSIHVTGKIIKFSRTPMIIGSTPEVGEHTREVLTEVLGYPESEIKALEAEEVIATGAPVDSASKG